MPREAREFQARLLDWKEIHSLPDGWPPDRLLSLLAAMEVDGVSRDEAQEMALLALQDLDRDEAAVRVLGAVFGDSMRPGVRQNLGRELTEERPWEDYADINRQAGIFNAVVLLQQAFPREYDKPDAVSVSLRLDTASEKGGAWLDAPAPDPALLLRILAGGMDGGAVLNRLFGEALEGSSFAEAGAILWHVSRRSAAARGREFALVSSHQWFDPLRGLDEWTATAWTDQVAR